jgi:ankyrin repeat protein
MKALEVAIKIESLAKNRDPIKEQEIFERLKNGRHSSDFQKSCFIVAIKNRYLEMAKYIIDQGFNLDQYNAQEAMRFSIKKGHFAEVEFLIRNGIEISKDDLQTAIKHLRWDICKLLIEKGFFSLSGMNSREFGTPLEAGHTDVIKMLVEYGADISSDALRSVVEDGDLESAKFLVKHDLRDYRSSYNSNVRFEDIEILVRERNLEEIKTRWVVFEDCRKKANEIFILAARNSFLELARFLIDDGVQISGFDAHIAMRSVVERGDLSFVTYLVENGIGVDRVRELVEIAENNNHVLVAEYLKSQGINRVGFLEDDAWDLYYAHRSEIGALMIQKDVEGIRNKMISYDFSTQQKAAILRDAVEGGYLDIAKYLLGEVNVRDLRGVQLLKIAAKNKDWDLVKLLIENGVNVKACRDDYYSPSTIENLIYDKNLEKISTIMAVSIFSKEEIESLLLRAVAGNDLNIAQHFLSNIADLSGVSGVKCLERALNQKNWELVKLLIEKGANYKACREVYSDTREIEELERAGKLEEIKTIFKISRFSKQEKHEMLFRFIRNHNTELAEALLDVGVNISGDGGINSFVMLIRDGNNDAAEFLIKHCWDIGLNSRLAMNFALRNQHYTIVDAFIKAGLDIYAYASEFLGSASSGGNLELVADLLAHGVDPRANNSEVLEFAMRNGHVNVAKALIERGADISVINPNLVVTVASHGKSDMLKFLIENHIGDQHLEQALKVAHNNKHTDIVKFLLKHGIKPSTIGDHALKDYVERNNCDMVRFLIKQGVDLSVVADELFKSAVSKKNEEMVECFLKIGVSITGIKMSGFSKNYHNLVNAIDQYYKDQFDPSLSWHHFFSELREQLPIIKEVFDPHATLALQRIIALKDPIFIKSACVFVSESKLLFPENTLSFINFAAKYSDDITKFVIENPKVIKSLNNVQTTYLFAEQQDSELPGLPIEVTQKILNYTLEEDIYLTGQVTTS